MNSPYGTPLREADRPLFLQGSSPAIAHGESASPWKIAIIDDDEAVHAVTKLALGGLTYKGRSLQFFNGYSGAEARDLFAEHPDIAVTLLDVMMETDRAGLDVVRHVREQLGNRMLRIILRTGEAGDTPENRMMIDYDINDFREKADLTVQKLIASIIGALRAYDDLLTIQELASSNEYLENQVRKRTKDLQQTNDSLQKEAATRSRALEALHRSETLLAEA